jgi:hypothetical protein
MAPAMLHTHSARALHPASFLGGGELAAVLNPVQIMRAR